MDRLVEKGLLWWMVVTQSIMTPETRINCQSKLIGLDIGIREKCLKARSKKSTFCRRCDGLLDLMFRMEAVYRDAPYRRKYWSLLFCIVFLSETFFFDASP